ncbi:PD-(D/E)XK nuclease-like domain-containing protein [Shewanella sp. SG44-6]|jgi:exodeoxyribonuclease VIII|uniref:PD-(D/E)XK nuclease-like domain-containing protein n=1 Tax=Shewanella sp. SG44-6 TaxID=2760959 RepID=UPI001603CF7F|nr:PD-(D/E)XK nuclease-like domain-containing protein [Shewanella sp. SG44-6]MBB1389471.1 PD-(D/E)XK nuclease-like domain-containing protein [Shewanella sp. SG44-6]
MDLCFDAFFDEAYAGPTEFTVTAPEAECTDPSLLIAANVQIKTPTVKVNVVSTKPTKKVCTLNKELSALAQPAYDDSGNPNFLDEDGALVDGIYLDLPNKTYQNLDAYGSSHFKTYITSPAHYYEKYLSDKKKEPTSTKHFEVGDITHELVLEGPCAVSERRFILIDPNDYPLDMHSSADLKAECERFKIKTSGTIYEKANRLSTLGKSSRMYFDFRQLQHIKNNVGEECFKEISKLIDDEDLVVTSDEVIKIIKSKNLMNMPLKQPVNPSDYKEAVALHCGMSRNKSAIKLFEKGVPEVTFIVTDPLTKLKLKCRTDWLSFLGDVILPTDLKTSRSCNPAVAAYQFAELSYDIQAVFYLYVIQLSGLVTPKRQFPFVTLEKGPSSICEVLEIHESDWDEAESTLPKLLQSFNTFISNKIITGYTKDGISVIKLAKRKNGFFLDL